MQMQQCACNHAHYHHHGNGYDRSCRQLYEWHLRGAQADVRKFFRWPLCNAGILSGAVTALFTSQSYKVLGSQIELVAAQLQ